MRVILINLISWIVVIVAVLTFFDHNALKWYYKHSWGQPAVKTMGAPPAIYVETRKAPVP